MKKIITLISVMAIVVLITGGIMMKRNKKEIGEVLNSSASIKVVHDLGKTTIKERPKRVIVFDYPTLDTLNALGIDSVVVGLPKESSLPETIKKYEDDKYINVGTLKEPNLEAVKSLNPDLIIISGRQASYYDQLTEIAPTISLAKDNKKYVESMKENINTLAEIFAVEEKATSEIKKIEEKIAEVNKKVTEKGLKSLTVMINEGNLSVYGDESRFALLYQGFGFKNVDENIEDSTHGQSITFEYISEKNPQYLFVLDRGAATGKESTAKTILDNEIMKSTDAYKNNNIIYLDPVTWYTNDGGLNSINIMIEDVINNIDKE